MSAGCAVSLLSQSQKLLLVLSPESIKRRCIHFAHGHEIVGFVAIYVKEFLHILMTSIRGQLHLLMDLTEVIRFFPASTKDVLR